MRASVNPVWAGSVDVPFAANRSPAPCPGKLQHRTMSATLEGRVGFGFGRWRRRPEESSSSLAPPCPGCRPERHSSLWRVVGGNEFVGMPTERLGGCGRCFIDVGSYQPIGCCTSTGVSRSARFITNRYHPSRTTINRRSRRVGGVDP